MKDKTMEKKIKKGDWVYHKTNKRKVKVWEFQPLDKEYKKSCVYLAEYNLPTRKEDYICVKNKIDCQCECGNLHKTKKVICHPISEFKLKI